MPQEIERGFDIGSDVYGRSVIARRHRDYMGRVMWKIVTTPANQRDDGERVDGLTDDNIKQLIEAMQEATKYP